MMYLLLFMLQQFPENAPRYYPSRPHPGFVANEDKSLGQMVSEIQGTRSLAPRSPRWLRGQLIEAGFAIEKAEEVLAIIRRHREAQLANSRAVEALLQVPGVKEDDVRPAVLAKTRQAESLREAELIKELKESLSDEELKYLTRLLLRREGIEFWTYPLIAEALELSDDQIGKIRAIEQQKDEASSRILKGTTPADLKGELRQKIAEESFRFRSKARMVLSLDQIDRMLVLEGLKKKGESWASFASELPHREKILEHWPKVAEAIEKEKARHRSDGATVSASR